MTIDDVDGDSNIFSNKTQATAANSRMTRSLLCPEPRRPMVLRRTSTNQGIKRRLRKMTSWPLAREAACPVAASLC